SQTTQDTIAHWSGVQGQTMNKQRSIQVLLAFALAALMLVDAGSAAAAYPGADGEVALTSTQDGPRQIFVAGSTGIRNLTGVGSAAQETQPKFSPDGREILFTRSAPGLAGSQLFVMSATGKDRVQLTHMPTGASDPTWSPDGTSVAFVSARGGGTPNIFTMRTDGTDLRQVTHDTAGKSELAWSPRGDEIAFVREPAGGGDRDIYSIKPNGTGMKDLTNDPANFDLQPAYSPDGDSIVYSGAGHPNGESVAMDLWIISADGGSSQPVEHQGSGYSDGAYPAWSPDGTTIAFAANDGTGYYHVWSVPATGGLNTPLVANSLPDGNPVDEEVDWQPLPANAAKPNTKLTRMQVNKHKRSVRFRFVATGATTSYRCALRAGHGHLRFKPCRSPTAYSHLKPGQYKFEVRAVGPGESDLSPAKREFKIGAG
ncbi:MAG: TolB family protein, partial [Solirubrobacteraceae bacterium]